MIVIIAQDIINDVTLIQTNWGFYCRYGLAVSEKYHDIRDALQRFNESVEHAIQAQGYMTEEDS